MVSRILQWDHGARTQSQQMAHCHQVLLFFALRKKVNIKSLFFRSNLCTGAIFRDRSEWQDGEFHLGPKNTGGMKYGGPCKGDWGTSLMVKEKERYAFTPPLESIITRAQPNY